MTYDARERARVRNAMLVISTVAWVLLLAAPGGSGNPHFHAHVHAGAAGLSMLPGMAANWLLMLVGMITPLLISPVRHIRQRSFASRRARSTALFVGGYGAMWMACGAAAFATQLGLNSVAPGSYWPAAGVAVMAAVWQCAPIKQRCLNRCHANRDLAAFGLAADRDAVRFGINQGVWCVASCWMLMLVPMLLPGGDRMAMGMAAILMLGERLEPARVPSWRWRGVTTVIRAATEQVRMRVQAGRSEESASVVSA